MLPDKDRSRALAQLCLQWGGLRGGLYWPPNPQEYQFPLVLLGFRGKWVKVPPESPRQPDRWQRGNRRQGQESLAGWWQHPQGHMGVSSSSCPALALTRGVRFWMRTWGLPVPSDAGGTQDGDLPRSGPQKQTGLGGPGGPNRASLPCVFGVPTKYTHSARQWTHLRVKSCQQAEQTQLSPCPAW